VQPRSSLHLKLGFSSPEFCAWTPKLCRREAKKTNKLVVSWLLMWALSYVVVAVVAPGVGGPPVWLSVVEYLVFGVALLAPVLIVGWHYLGPVNIAQRYYTTILHNNP